MAHFSEVATGHLGQQMHIGTRPNQEMTLSQQARPKGITNEPRITAKQGLVRKLPVRDHVRDVFAFA